MIAVEEIQSVAAVVLDGNHQMWVNVGNDGTADVWADHGGFCTVHWSSVQQPVTIIHRGIGKFGS